MDSKQKYTPALQSIGRVRKFRFDMITWNKDTEAKYTGFIVLVLHNNMSYWIIGLKGIAPPTEKKKHVLCSLSK